MKAVESHIDYNAMGRREQRRTRLIAQVAASAGLDPETDLGSGGPMLRTGEVAVLFGVSERCIRNWANAGKLPSVRTLGRHRLFPAREVALVLREAMKGDQR
ncbi:MAG TPA: helix-turn-helix domain-containing protein [Actinomycetota bacterium]|nr:helix-turn-helix domain-containing protein [Actinomycetota bacterium]